MEVDCDRTAWRRDDVVLVDAGDEAVYGGRAIRGGRFCAYVSHLRPNTRLTSGGCGQGNMSFLAGSLDISISRFRLIGSSRSQHGESEDRSQGKGSGECETFDR